MIPRVHVFKSYQSLNVKKDAGITGRIVLTERCVTFRRVAGVADYALPGDDVEGAGQLAGPQARGRNPEDPQAASV